MPCWPPSAGSDDHPSSGRYRLSQSIAAAIDLAGRDVYEAVKRSVDPKVIDCPDPGKGRATLDGVCKNGIQLRARARVTVRTKLSSLVGGATEETIIARVGEGYDIDVQTITMPWGQPLEAAQAVAKGEEPQDVAAGGFGAEADGHHPAGKVLRVGAERFARRGEEANADWRSLNFLLDGWLKALARQAATPGQSALIVPAVEL